MEKKTIGKFIAALRKANGMTQKDLAEKLNVSDKSISRWERDECSPDLLLIPVLADIFGITSDELLRGERLPINSSEKNASTDENVFSAKSEKQVKYLLNKLLVNYKIKILVVSALALVGNIVAFVLNVFNKALLGFGMSVIIYIIAAVCLAAFAIIAYSKISAEEFEGKNVNQYKKSIAYNTWIAASVIFIMFCAVLPLLVVEDAYWGLDFASWLILAMVCILIGIIICLVSRFFITGLLIKRDIITENNTIHYNRVLIKKTSVIITVVLAATFIIQISFNRMADGDMWFVKGTQFNNYFDFKAYVEAPTDFQTDDNLSYVVTTVSNSDNDGDQEVICDSQGKVLCSYTVRNQDVVRIEYFDSDNCLPITVYTSLDYANYNKIMNSINIVYLSIYFIEIIAAILIYRKKRLK